MLPRFGDALEVDARWEGVVSEGVVDHEHRVPLFTPGEDRDGEPHLGCAGGVVAHRERLGERSSEMVCGCDHLAGPPGDEREHVHRAIPNDVRPTEIAVPQGFLEADDGVGWIGLEVRETDGEVRDETVRRSLVKRLTVPA